MIGKHEIYNPALDGGGGFRVKTFKAAVIMRPAYLL